MLLLLKIKNLRAVMPVWIKIVIIATVGCSGFYLIVKLDGWYTARELKHYQEWSETQATRGGISIPTN